MKQSTMHFKLTNGEEVICQVIDWAEDNEDDYIVRNALNVIQTKITENHTRYMFKPWFTMVEGSGQYICVSKEHIVACTTPSNILFTEYRRAVNQMSASAKMKSPSMTSANELYGTPVSDQQAKEFDQIQKEILNLINEMESQSKVEEIYDEDYDLTDYGDSDEPSNVIKFPGPGSSIH